MAARDTVEAPAPGRGLRRDGTIEREGALDGVPRCSGRYYPERAGQIRLAAGTGRTLSADPAVPRLLIDDLGPWLGRSRALAGGRVRRRARREGTEAGA